MRDRSDTRRVKVTRTLTYEGPKWWVDSTLEASAVKPGEPSPSGGGNIQEEHRTLEFLDGSGPEGPEA